MGGRRWLISNKHWKYVIQKYKSSNLQAKPFQVQAIKSDQMRGSLEADQDQDQDHPQPLF